MQKYDNLSDKQLAAIWTDKWKKKLFTKQQFLNDNRIGKQHLNDWLAGLKQSPKCKQLIIAHLKSLDNSNSNNNSDYDNDNAQIAKQLNFDRYANEETRDDKIIKQDKNDANANNQPPMPTAGKNNDDADTIIELNVAIVKKEENCNDEKRVTLSPLSSSISPSLESSSPLKIEQLRSKERDSWLLHFPNCTHLLPHLNNEHIRRNTLFSKLASFA